MNGMYWYLEPADQITACPATPAGGRCRLPHLDDRGTGMEEAGDEPLFCERAAGIDTGKAVVMVTTRVPSESRDGGRQQETREFGTTRRQLLALADRLRCRGAEKAGTESTSDYRKPVFFLLERGGLDCLLYPSSQAKALPGRPKTDKLDSVWLARITGQGPLAGSFVPPEEIRRLRTHTRCRGRLVRAPHGGEGALREAAGGRAPEAVVGDRRHPRGLRPGHADRDHRRRAQPESAGGDGPGRDAPQGRPAGRGPGLLVLRPRARLHPGDDAGQHRPLRRPRSRCRTRRSPPCASRMGGRSPSWTPSPASGSPPPGT